MNRKKRLLKFQDAIGGLNAKKVSELQKSHDLPIGKDLTDKTLMEIFDHWADLKFDFKSFKSLIKYERQLQRGFESLTAEIKKNTAEMGHIGTLKKLQRNLADILEALENSYITINSEYQTYIKRAETINAEIEDHIEHKRALNG